MSYLVEQARENAYRMGHEHGLPGIITWCLDAGMTCAEARKVLYAAKDKRNPHQFARACIKRWRAER